MTRFVSAIALGFVLAWGAAHAMFLQWWTLVPWGLAGVALGYRAIKGQAMIAGALYGFVVCFMFTLLGYGGTAPLIRRVPFFTALGLVGALCGLLLARLGTLVGTGHRAPTRAQSTDDAA
jgi:hypothetical protein